MLHDDEEALVELALEDEDDIMELTLEELMDDLIRLEQDDCIDVEDEGVYLPVVL